MEDKNRLESYTEGYNDFENDYRITENPYVEDTDSWHEWNNGYKQAQKDLSEVVYGKKLIN